MIEALLAGLLGLFLFYLLLGFFILNPLHVSWLLEPNNQDTVQHFIGWEFFRHESWHFPLGLILQYGAPLGTSIVYTDSVPLFALLFKCFQSDLPAHFQYFGIWFACCFFLQGFFACLISHEISQNFYIKLLITSFFLLSPIMLNRLIEHQALSAHWVILAALWLYIKPYTKKSNPCWLVLNVITILIHAYLSFLILFIWIAFIIKNKFIRGVMSSTSFLLQVGCYFFCISILAWLAGYFIFYSSQSVKAGGFIFNAMNLLAPIFPTSGSEVLSSNWSLFLHPLGHLLTRQGDEGFNYFGMGELFLIIFSLLYCFKNKCWMSKEKFKEYLPLLLVCFFFFLFSLSNKIYVGQYNIINYSFPNHFEAFSEVFRNPGRFFWPAYYLIMIAAFFVVSRLPKKRSICLLSVALLLQLLDLSPKLRELVHYFHHPSPLIYPMTDPFWGMAEKKYTTLAFLPITEAPQLEVRYFQDYLYYAATHNMKVNNGYFARYDKVRLWKLRQQLSRQMYQGQFDSHTLYVIIDPSLISIIRAKSPPYSKIIHLLGYYVLAPNWFSSASIKS